MEETSDIQKRYPLKLWLVLTPYVLLPLLGAILLILHHIVPSYNVIVLVLVAVSYSSLSLLGIWVGLSGTVFWRRIIGAALGIFYVAILVTVYSWGLSRNNTPISMIMILPYYFKLCSLPVVLIAGALLGIRRFGVRLCLLDQDSRQNEKFQFSLRSLMGLTLAVAILFSAISSCRVYYPDILNNAIDLLSVVIVALVTVWAGLGRGRTLLRILIVLFAAICVGLLSGFAIGSQYAGRTISIMVDSLIYTMLQYFFIIMPLLVVRSMGYRIVRVENTPESVDTLHT